MIEGTFTLHNTPSMKKRAFNRIVAEALREPLHYWYHHFLPLHFTEAAKKRYSYTVRSLRYTRRKRREKGHIKPLVWSGRLQRDALKKYRITTNSKRGRVAMWVPWYINYDTEKSSGENTVIKKAEMLRVIKPEIEEMAGVFARAIERGMAKVDEPDQKVRI